MATDRWEQRAGLWVRRRDDGDWDWFPSLVERASGFRLKESFFARLEQSELIGKALAFGLGAPVMIAALVVLAIRPAWGFLGDGGIRGFAFLLGLLIVAGTLVARSYVRRSTLSRAATSDTELSPGELRDLRARIGSEIPSAMRPGLSNGARAALIFALGTMSVLAVAVFLIAFALGLQTLMLVAGIVATLCLLITLRLWHLAHSRNAGQV
ncbi:MAG TPA: hypothetical protein VHA10_15300 [Hypericibacter adhaerens]|jgi:hypothetical protein|uniref:Uncharacterized protein n=1 Tax=Hypericibacter adhaerens TaxID=2602016 RepID=A0A5J6MXB3_9PROT|nr:hypothetical protein [Hypericibacter adhaerens]QEX20860.1 hypothetical protein FRZ61_07800 [Hypericibacter adhaerens]HWA44581.1 hypothetical protein [Hypericibacter adhaerens]